MGNETTASLVSLLGTRAYLPVGEGVLVEVRIEDVKIQWGKTRYLICPVAGYGQRWVENLEIPAPGKG